MVNRLFVLGLKLYVADIRAIHLLLEGGDSSRRHEEHEKHEEDRACRQTLSVLLRAHVLRGES